MKPISFRLLLRHLHHTVMFLLVWAVFLNGCSSWRTLEKPPSENNPKKVLVTLKDESKVTVFNAYAKGMDGFGPKKGFRRTSLMARADSLFGYESKENLIARTDTLFGYESKVTGRGLKRNRPRPTEVEIVAPPNIAIPLRDISFIEEKYTSTGKTIPLVLLGTVVFLGAVAVLTCCDFKIDFSSIPPL